MRKLLGSVVLKALLLAVTLTALCVAGQRAEASTVAVPLQRRPTPTVPPVPSKPMSLIDASELARLEELATYEASLEAQAELLSQLAPQSN